MITRRTVVLLTGLLVSLGLSTVAQVQTGDSRAEVLRVMGSPVHNAKIGQIENMSFKNGTKVLLKNGIVQEVTVPGLVRIGDSTKVLERPKPVVAVVEPKSAPPAKLEQVPSAKPEQVVPVTVAVASTNEPPKHQAQLAAAHQPTPTKPADTKAASVSATSMFASLDGFIAKAKKVIAGMLIVFAAVGLLMYAGMSFCFKLICEKAGKPGGVLVWIPVAQIIPLLRVAGMREWMLVLFFIPIVNLLFTLVLWAKICFERGKNPWLAATLLIPVVNLFLIPYLAFSRANAQPVEAQPAGNITATPVAAATEIPPTAPDEQMPPPTDEAQPVTEPAAVA